jgi:hypothetical protein
MTLKWKQQKCAKNATLKILQMKTFSKIKKSVN